MNNKHIAFSITLLNSLFSVSLIRSAAEPMDVDKLIMTIHQAAKRGDLDSAKQLIAQGTGINSQNRHGKTPLHIAIKYGHHDLIEFLLNHGATTNGRPPLEIAKKYRRASIEHIYPKLRTISTNQSIAGTPLTHPRSIETLSPLEALPSAIITDEIAPKLPNAALKQLVLTSTRFAILLRDALKKRFDSIHYWSQPTIQSKVLEGHTNIILSVAFSPDGNTIASGANDTTIKLWNINNTQCINTINGHSSGVRSVIFSLSNNTLASGSQDKTVRLWNIHSSQCVKSLSGHAAWVESLVISPDSHTLASGSSDKTIKLWDIHSGNCINTLSGHTARVNDVAFSPNGHTLASGSDDKTIRLWQATNK